MWEPIGGSGATRVTGAGSAGADAATSSDSGHPAPSDRFTLACGVLVLALTCLWTHHLLIPLLLLPLQPPPWPASVLHPPLAVAASLLFLYGVWLAQAFYLAGADDDKDV